MANIKTSTALFSALSIFLPGLVLSQTAFTFSLPKASRTSAGVYKNDGTLIRTLWSGLNLDPGSHARVWNGADDEGGLAAEGEYQIRILSNNVDYKWEGVIGNTSDAVTGPGIHRGLIFITGMAVSGGTVYYSAGYPEGNTAFFKFNTANPQTRTPILPAHETNQESRFVATDGINVYWAGKDPFAPDKWFVVATGVSDDLETAFPGGVPLKMTHGRTYVGAIDFQNDAQAVITGVAVQKSGKYLFVSHENQNRIHILDKSTGALAGTFGIPSPRHLALDAAGNLWVSHGARSVSKYTVLAGGALSETGATLPDLAEPLALAVSFDGKTVVVADGGASQQVKAYRNADGASNWSLGKAGGYAVDAGVADDKFYFNDRRSDLGSFIAFQADGSFWVGDMGNMRAQHYDSARAFVDRIMYLPRHYTCRVDPNNPTRVFSDYLEFAVDYSLPLSPKNGSWTLVKNWGYNIGPGDDDQFQRLSTATTLGNGRTYALLLFNGKKDPRQVVELVGNGAVRFTGLTVAGDNQIYPDGSLRRVIHPTSESQAWVKSPLTGFDASQDPQWGAETAVTGNVGLNPRHDGHSVRNGEVTSSDIVVAFNGARGSEKFHLGGIRLGESKWLWKSARATQRDYAGPFPADGSYDIGNGVEYAGSVAMALDRSIFWGYHGEFWKAAQTNKWNHVYDNGLLVGQFGTLAGAVAGESPAEMAGNAFVPSMIKHANGDYYLYHGDESYHAGVHRWRISGLNTLAEQTVSVTLAAKPNGLWAERFKGSALNNAGFISAGVEAGINSPSQSDAIRWRGFVEPEYSQTYAFFTSTSNGVRLWINDSLLIDKPANASLAEFSGGPLPLIASRRYRLRMEIWGGSASLSWSSAGQSKQIIPSNRLFPADAIDRSTAIDLMEGLPHHRTLDHNLYGWSRNLVSDAAGWKAITSVNTFDPMASPDVYLDFAATSGTYTLSRDLGNHAGLLNWRLKGLLSFENGMPNIGENGSFLEVLDAAGKVITSLHHAITFEGARPITVYANAAVLKTGPEAVLRGKLASLQPFQITLNSAGATFSLADFAPATLPIMDASADWKAPKTFRLRFQRDGKSVVYASLVDIDSMRFSTNVSAGVKPVPAFKPAIKLNGAINGNLLRIGYPQVAAKGTVSVFSGSGRVLKSWNLVQGSAYAVLDVAFLPRGFYSIEFKDGQSHAYLRLSNLKL